MKDTRLTALETELPSVPRSGKASASPLVGGGRKGIGHLVYGCASMFLCIQDLTSVILAACLELDLLWHEVTGQTPDDLLIAYSVYSVPGTVKCIVSVTYFLLHNHVFGVAPFHRCRLGL